MGITKATGLALPLSLLVLAVYVALLPWTGQVWRSTGDEPHYLIAADSLVRDGDLDLRNNYDPAVYLEWYATHNLAPQVKTRADGAQFLMHPYGLSILVAPAYWLGGARGAAYFMAVLGALLAGQVYLLALQVTQNWPASALGALAVAFAPPLVWYAYLLYPEVPGALCVTVAARALVGSHTPSGSSLRGMAVGLGGVGSQLTLGLVLAALPWLSARFLPAALVLAGLAAWRVLRLRGRGGRGWLWAWPSLLLALSLLGMAAFNARLYGRVEPTASFNGDVGPGPVSWPLLLQFVRGLFGWLLDHQRGLLAAGPIYFVALVGLGQWLWRRAWGALVVGLPFAFALASTALVGGFWVGIEPGARYLVYVLPPLGAALAYGWAHRRGPWLAGLTGLALAASLWTAAQVFRDPLLAQTHDLIGERVAWLVPYLPALAHPTYLTPGAPGDLALRLADPPAQPAFWRVPKGQVGSAFQQPAIADFTFGWYQLQFELGARGAPADAPVARVLFQAGDHTPLVDTMLYGRDFSPDGQPHQFSFSIFNQVYNQWEQPPGLWIFTTGQAEVTLSRIALLADDFHSLVVPGLWLAGLALLGVLVGSRFWAEAGATEVPRWLGGWWPGLAGAALVLAVGAWSLRPVPRRYPVTDLSNYIGARVADLSAPGVALSTADDEGLSGVLAANGPEMWPAGRYRWRLSLKAGAAPADGAPVATVAIHASRQPISGATAEIGASAVPADGQFHTVDIVFDNPLHQALAFELDATGAAALESLGFEMDPAP